MLWIRTLVALAAAACLASAAGPRKTKNIILVTADGLRWQDVFSGIDPVLMKEKSAGMEEEPALGDKLWRPSAEERRKALMPFLWTKLAPNGVVLGNLNKKSSVRVSNGFRVSYPGYAEILTGRAQDEVIRGNDNIQNPTPTVLEFLRQKLRLRRSQVALFGSWHLFHAIGESRPGSIFINAGYRQLDLPSASARLRDLSALQFQALTPWGSVRHDYVTFEMALEYLKTARPRVLHIAFGETDDWAHDKRYDRVLQTISYFDRCLDELWETVESLAEYRAATSLIITSDHGRGGTLEDWHGHGAKVAGSEQIWIAILGPDTPAGGEASQAPEVWQRDVAPTILDLLGIDYREYQSVQGKPIALARVKPKER